MIKLWISCFLYYTGLLNLLQFFNNLTGKRLTIVMLHQITPADFGKGTSLMSICLSSQNFEKVVDYIARRYRVISFAEYGAFIKGSKPIPRNSMIITFDDGYRHVYSEALPVLRKRGLPSTLFVISSGLEGDNPDFWWDRLTFYCHLLGAKSAAKLLGTEVSGSLNAEMRNALTGNATDPDAVAIAAADVLSGAFKEMRSDILSQLKERCPAEDRDKFQSDIVDRYEIREMMQNGVEIGSHTKNHCFLDVVSENEAWEEISDSRSIIREKLDADVSTFAYPGGRFTRKTREMVVSAGYDFAVSVESGLNNRLQDPFSLKRINLCDDWVEDSRGRFQPSLLATRLVLTEFIQQLRSLKNALLPGRSLSQPAGVGPVSVTKDRIEDLV